MKELKARVAQLKNRFANEEKINAADLIGTVEMITKEMEKLEAALENKQDKKMR